MSIPTLVEKLRALKVISRKMVVTTLHVMSKERWRRVFANSNRCSRMHISERLRQALMEKSVLAWL